MSDTTEWVVLDTETDGLYAPIHVVEIAAQRMCGPVPIGDPFQIFINHNVPISDDACAIHGYTQEFLSANGVSPQEAYTQLRTFVGRQAIAAHNLAFDWNQALFPEWTRLNIPPIGRKGLCTWQLARRLIADSATHRLDYLRNRFSLRCRKPHSALGDVESVIDLFQRILYPILNRIGVESFEQLREFSIVRPIMSCLCLVQGKNFAEEMKRLEPKRQQARLAKQRLAEIEALLRQIELGSATSVPFLISQHQLIDEEPDIQFARRVFLFTGKLSWGSRSRAEVIVWQRGGRLAKSKTVSKEVDYLVLGEDKDAGWTSLLHGRKLGQAFKTKLTDPRGKLHIILESDFIAAANAALETRQVAVWTNRPDLI